MSGDGPYRLWTGTPNTMTQVASGELIPLKKKAQAILTAMLPDARKFESETVPKINQVISEINGVWMRDIPPGDRLQWSLPYMGIMFVIAISRDASVTKLGRNR